MGGGLLAGLHFHVQDHPRAAPEVGVIEVGGTAAFVGVVAHFGPFLMAVEGLDGGIDVQDPRHAQEGGVAFPQVLLLPVGHGGFGGGVAVAFGQGAAQRIGAGHLAQAQQGGVDAVAAQRADMGIAVMPGQHAQQRGAAEVAHGGGVGAGVVPGAVRDPALEAPAGLEELGKEDQLAQRCDRCLGIPLHPDAPAAGVELEVVRQR